MNLEYGTINAAESTVFSVSSRRSPDRAKLRLRLQAGLVTLDTLCIFAGFFLAGLIYQPGSDPSQWLVTSLVMTPLYITMGLNARAYSTAGIQDPGLGVKRAVQAFVIAAGAFLLVAFYLKTSDTFSRVILALGSGTSIVLLAGVRAVFLRKARGIVGGNPYNVVLITDGGQHIAHDGFSLVVPANAHLDPSLDCPMMFDRLAITLRDADRVIVTCEASRRLDWVKALKGANVRAEILAPELDSLAPLGLGSWGAAPTIVVADGPLGKLDLLVKRAFDVATALVALVVLAPVLIVTAILIKLESKGPVFFVQTRIGQGNRMFRMLKFRSMRVESSDGAGVTSTRRDDDRITRVGAAIRKTSIDELPQLLNVLIGDMSIVGPRPHALGSRAEDKLFWEIDKRYWHRHAAKPGLTGLAQVRGYRGATAVESDLTDRLQADLEYLRDWSIWKDFKIVLLTFGVLVHRNAY